MKKVLYAIFIGIYTCFFYVIQATVIITGNNDIPPMGFTVPITATELDRPTGNFFVGLSENGGSYVVSRAVRPNFTSAEQFIPIGSISVLDDLLLNQPIEFLSLSSQPLGLPLVNVVTQNDLGQFLQTYFLTITGNGTDGAQSVSLHDALAMTTAGIVNMKASPFHVYAAVRPSVDAVSMLDNFGDAGSGISVSTVNTNNNNLIIIETKDATTGLDGNKAVALNGTIEPVKGTSGGDDATINPAMVDINQLALFFDQPLNTLYIGMRVKSGMNITDIAKAVVRGQPNIFNINQLNILEIAPDSVLDNSASAEQRIFVQGAERQVSIKKIGVLHPTTGPSYLIVNGGNGTAAQVGNQIWAFPLVDDPTNSGTHGTIAKKDSQLTDNGKFTVPATIPADLPGFMPLPDDASSQVGASLVPIQAEDDIFNMILLDDTVYISIAQAPTEENETGVLYSQAQFDEEGRIIRWTPWTKSAAPYNSFAQANLANEPGPISFFDVDAVTGNLWLVDAATQEVVGSTAWSTGIAPTGLIAQVSKAIPRAALSVLDLDQSTRGFVDANGTVNRYALFGGGRTVVFTRVSVAQTVNDITSPQQVIQDFSLPANLLKTTCPGCVSALEYSRREPAEGNNLNYFFAGSDQGLFVFTNDLGQGFNVSDLSTVDSTLFINRTWQKVTTIPGFPVALHSSQATPTTTTNGALYILANQLFEDGNIVSTLYAVPYQSTTSAMFNVANIRIIAQSGQGVLENVGVFTGFQVVSTGQKFDDSTIIDSPNKEQIVLIANQGLYISDADQTGTNQGILDAINQTDAQWSLISDTETVAYLGINGPETPIRHTVWPFNIVSTSQCGSFEQGIINQISAAGNFSGTDALFDTFKPTFFNAKGNPPAFQTFDPITYFWSDGARRFFILNQVNDQPGQNFLSVIPYNVHEWRAGSPQAISQPLLGQFNHFFWLQEIGITGLVLAGTNAGVIGLE